MSYQIEKILKMNGYYYEDNFLDNELFKRLNNEVIKSFKSKKNWKTKIKINDEVYSLPILDHDDFIEVSTKLKKFTKENSFNYIYNSLHQDEDTEKLITKIFEVVIKNWKKKSDIFKDEFEKNFSLTCYTSGSFLDWHTDYSRDPTKNYKITILLYFGDDREYKESECLSFKYNNKTEYIEPKPNRAIIFIPNSESIHGIFPNNPNLNFNSYSRYAFSGWLI